MKVWLLWDSVDYEGSSLEGVFSSEAKAERARTRLRNRWRHEFIGYGVGPDETYETKKDAREAADRSANERLRITAEVVR